MSSSAASASKGSTNEAALEDKRNAEVGSSIDSDDCSFDGVEIDSSDSFDNSDSDREDDHADEVARKRPAFGNTSTKSNVTDEDLGAKDLLRASALQAKKTRAMAKALYATKGTIRLAE